MYSAKIQPRQTGPVEFKSEKPFYTVPVIIEEIEDDAGEKYYLCEGGRLFKKDAYDRNFKVAHGLKMHPAKYKGKSLDSRAIY